MGMEEMSGKIIFHVKTDGIEVDFSYGLLSPSHDFERTLQGPGPGQAWPWLLLLALTLLQQLLARTNFDSFWIDFAGQWNLNLEL